MKIRTGLGALALALGSVIAVRSIAAQSDEDMKKMMEMGAPSEAHKLLDDKVGKWNMKVKMFMVPGLPPMESEATSEMKWILGGRFIEDHTQGTFGGMPFNGLGHAGYDNLNKKYVGTWMDTMGTAIMTTQGSYDAATKTFTYSGEMADLMQGKMVKTRSTEKMVDKDHMVMSMYAPGPDGKEFLNMEISYTRAK